VGLRAPAAREYSDDDLSAWAERLAATGWSESTPTSCTSRRRRRMRRR
jgi:hypothetical protein